MKKTLDPNIPALGASGETLGRHTVIQHSTLAGFRHHAASQVWPALGGHALLTLEREGDNPHDPDAVAVYWKRRKLGYLPRGENFLVARLLDRERMLSARVRRLLPNAAHNRRVRMDVLLHGTPLSHSDAAPRGSIASPQSETRTIRHWISDSSAPRQREEYPLRRKRRTLQAVQ